MRTRVWFATRPGRLKYVHFYFISMGKGMSFEFNANGCPPSLLREGSFWGLIFLVLGEWSSFCLPPFLFFVFYWLVCSSFADSLCSSFGASCAHLWWFRCLCSMFVQWSFIGIFSPPQLFLKSLIVSLISCLNAHDDIARSCEMSWFHARRSLVSWPCVSNILHV